MSTRTLFGDKHNELVRWLHEDWWLNGPPVCVIQGFAGVGKTEVMHRFTDRLRASGAPVCKTNIPEGVQDDLADFWLQLGQELAEVGEAEPAQVLKRGEDAAQVLGSVVGVLAKPVLLVLDEFQRLLDDDAEPIRQFKRLLERLVQHSTVRLLILTNRKPLPGRWSEHGISFQPLSALEAPPARQFLDAFLAEKRLDTELPTERRDDVVRWLKGNPRAIQTVGIALEYFALDDLVGLEPDLWTNRDRLVSEHLLQRFEHDVLAKVLTRLLPQDRNVLLYASVFRRSFELSALRELVPDPKQLMESQQRLVENYLFQHDRRWLSLNEVAREVARQKLRAAPRNYARAHGIAAEYYARHFRAQQVTQDERLGGYFIEARYHFVQAGQPEKLAGLVRPFQGFVERRYSRRKFVPQDLVERDEHIATILALRDDGAILGDDVAFYVAKCLVAKGERRNQETALEVLREINPIAPGIWQLRFRLETLLSDLDTVIPVVEQALLRVPNSKLELCRRAADVLMDVDAIDHADRVFQLGMEHCSDDEELSIWCHRSAFLLTKRDCRQAAIRLLTKGIAKIPAGKTLTGLYSHCADLLVKDGKTTDAIQLLRDGIQHDPPLRNLSTLYQLCADLLAKDGKADDAIQLLRARIRHDPPLRGVKDLYISCGDLLVQAGHVSDAIQLLREGIGHDPPLRGVGQLYLACGSLLAQDGQVSESIQLLREGIRHDPPLSDVGDLYQACGNLLAQDGQVSDAIQLLREGIRHDPPLSDVGDLYIACGNLLAQDGQVSDAIQLLREGIRHDPPLSGVGHLYIACGNLLAQDGQVSDAIQLLREGIGHDPFLSNVGHLYIAYGNLLARDGQVSDAIQLLCEGIGHDPPLSDVGDLYVACADLMVKVGQAERAFNLIDEGLRRVPKDQWEALWFTSVDLSWRAHRADWLQSLLAMADRVPLSQRTRSVAVTRLHQLNEEWEQAAQALEAETGLIFMKAFCWLAARKSELASELLLLMTTPYPLTPDQAWICCITALRIGNVRRAQESFVRCFGDSVQEMTPTELDVIRFWNSSIGDDTNHPALKFPILPPSISGYTKTVVRPLNGEPVAELTEWLESASTRIVTPAPSTHRNIFRKLGDGWEISFNAQTIHLSEPKKGLERLHRLLLAEGRPIRSDELADAPIVETSIDPKSDLAVDEETIRAVKGHLEKLKQGLESPIDLSLEEIRDLREEIEKGEHYLKQSTGLRGQSRPLDRRADLGRADTAVRNSIKLALIAIKSHLPALAEHLEHCGSCNSHCFKYSSNDPVPKWELV